MQQLEHDLQYDLVIIGGGLVGASMLLALTKLSDKLKIAIIEAKDKTSNKLDPAINLSEVDEINGPANNYNIDQYKSTNLNKLEDYRSLVLSLSSKMFYHKLGLWDKISKYTTIIKDIKISEQGRFNKLFLNYNNLNLESLGYIINLDILDKLIWQEITEYNNIDIYTNTSVSNINNSQLELKLYNKTKYIKANIIIAADGARSQIRDLLNIKTAVKNYNQTAIIANIEHELENKNIAYERFLGHKGSFAILPIDKHISGIVWAVVNNTITNSNNKDINVKKLSSENLINNIQDIMGYKLGKILNISAVQNYPLYQVKAQQLYQNNVILLGSSANNIHPIGGQGFNLGLRDINVLSQLILSKYNKSNTQEIFSEYAALRENDHNNLCDSTDNLIKLFESDNFFTKIARKSSLTAANHSFILKNIIAQNSMGLGVI